ncbi:MAG: acyl carrier protein [Corallococcus sp.]|nr:acyl carrier protein [Corallococcus sp.]MCM1359272.1 acyl carrier protein [Corallococcus sp.]MCM1394663.1 acyl carrier protein [Corallococcus sp.]
MMTFEKVQKLIAQQFGIDPSKVTLESDLVKDLGADSLDIADLIMTLEDEFGLTVPDEMANDFLVVGNIVNFIDKK